MNSNKVYSPRQREARGFILIASLMILLLLAILTASMSKNGGVQELVAGSHREKTRAFESAQAALNYAEWWLNTQVQNGNITLGASQSAAAPCTTTTTIANLNTSPNQPNAICTNALANPTTLPWTVGISYTPPNMNISTTGGSGTYYAIPMFYIQYLPPAPTYPVTSPLTQAMYVITAYGQGGDTGSVAVIQSIFRF